jgi:energy-coupling factor transporter transmembrane protein EcfT
MKVALMRRIFERADDLVIAMEARAFREDRTDPRLTARKCDWLALPLVGCLCIVLMVLS